MLKKLKKYPEMQARLLEIYPKMYSLRFNSHISLKGDEMKINLDGFSSNKFDPKLIGLTLAEAHFLQGV